MAFTKSIILWKKDEEKINDIYNDNPLGKSSSWMNNKQKEIDAAVQAGIDKVAFWDQDSAEETSPKVVIEDKYETISLDVVLSESHTFSNEITGYPVSEGFQISEHVIRKNPQFTLQGWVTDVAMPTAIVSFNTLGKVAGAMFARDSSSILGSLLSSAGNVVDNLGYENSSPVKDAFEVLKKLVRNGTVVHVSTILGTYENCVLRSVSIQQNITNSSVLPVTLNFEKVYIIGDRNDLTQDPLDYVDPDIKRDMKQVENNKTGSYLTDLYGQLTKQGVNISQVLMGVSYNGSVN